MQIMELLQQEWAIRALLASCMVGAMCGVLGCFIVLRNMSLIGDALSHAVLPGVVLAFVVVGGHNSTGFFIGSVVAGLVAALAMTWIQQNMKTKSDAAVGIVFTAMFSVGVIGISWLSQKEGIHLDLKDFLFGNILGIKDQDLYLTIIVGFLVLYSVLTFYRSLFASTFQSVIARTMGISTQGIHYFLMLLLSFAVVASLQTVGVILVVAMLITPASTALLLSNRLQIVICLAGLLGIAAALLGFALAVSFETTPGPAMVLVATVFYILAVIFAPTKGFLIRFLKERHLKRRMVWEDALKHAYRQLEEVGSIEIVALRERLKYTEEQLDKVIKILLSKKYILNKNTKEITLSEKGKAMAVRLVRAHRLWETYLVKQIGLNEAQIHDDAEEHEHYLTDEQIDDLDEKLGFPTRDPHGSPIPPK